MAMAMATRSVFLFTLLLLFLQTLTQASVAVNISDAVRASGFMAMSRILQNSNLVQTVPYGNKGITIFAPGDEALDGVDDCRVNLAHQIVPFKVDSHFFKNSCLADGSCSEVELPTLDKRRKLLATRWGRQNGRYHVDVNNVRIVEWNVYDDGHVIVHGVPTLFPYRGDD